MHQEKRDEILGKIQSRQHLIVMAVAEDGCGSRKCPVFVLHFINFCHGAFLDAYIVCTGRVGGILYSFYRVDAQPDAHHNTSVCQNNSISGHGREQPITISSSLFSMPVRYPHLKVAHEASCLPCFYRRKNQPTGVRKNI